MNMLHLRSLHPVKQRSTTLRAAIWLFSFTAITLSVGFGHAQDTIKQSTDQNVTYQPDYFDQYNPITALDMVRRVPGFILDRGDDVRGFGGAAGNVLINSERPSTKSDDIESILRRIPRNNVERIELIRGATGNLNLGTGNTVVVNVITSNDAGAGSYELTIVEREGYLEPRGEISYTYRLGATTYTIGINRFGFDVATDNIETLTNVSGPDELRNERELGGRHEWGLDLKTETNLLENMILRLNLLGESGSFESSETSLRNHGEASDFNIFEQSRDNNSDEFEFSGDFEYAFNDVFQGKAIWLANREYRDNEGALNVSLFTGDMFRSRSETSSTNGETLGRLEFDWSEWKGHSLQFGAELADNFVDNDFRLFRNEGLGEIEIFIPGANTRVAETRSEIFLSDSWSLSPRFNLDLGVNYETSEISQSGDVDNSRRFNFTKPFASLTFLQSDKSQWQIRFEREVGQLDFFDFVSSANFGDNDLDIGNPELSPDTSWILESSHERRFGEIGVVEFTLFYNDIQDVIDVVPTGATTEAPGNIGDGERYGFEINGTLPFDLIGLQGTRLDLEYRRQFSSVNDPVTREIRIFSSERPYTLDTTLRKEFLGINSAFEVNYRNFAEETSFGIDEIDRDGGFDRYDLLWETTFSSGLKATFELRRAFNNPQTRIRTIYDGSRDSDKVQLIENRRRWRNDEILISVSGAF